jgi:CheY-like chemotaxis protein
VSIFWGFVFGLAVGGIHGAASGSGAAHIMSVALIADDDAVCRALCVHALASTPYTPVAASTGGSAIRMVLDCHPALVLMDLHLPDLEACTVLARILAEWPAACAESLWLGMTASHEPADSSRMLNAGFRHVLTKPFTMDQLRGLVPDPEGRAHPPQSGGTDGSRPDLRTAFLADLARLLNDLDNAFAVADWKYSTQILHRIRGAAALAGYPGFAQRGYELSMCASKPHAKRQLVDTYLDFLSAARDLSSGIGQCAR